MLNRLLVVVDAHDTSDVAISEGLRLAELNRSTVLLAGILPSFTPPLIDIPSASVFGSEVLQGALAEAVRGRVERALGEANRLGVRAAFHLFDPPATATEVAALATAEGCDTIIVASEGRSALARLLFGSLIPGLITHAPMPVLVCKAVREDETAALPVPPAPTPDPTASFRRPRRRRLPTGGRLAGIPA